MIDKTPVLFLIFNRPQLTQSVFTAIREYRPQRLYIAADGPRSSRPDDVHLCERSRKIIDQIDWDCEVKTLFRSGNLGCGRAVSEAISWFFDNEEAGVILEDDCLPDKSFFDFCGDLLDKYKDNEQIMHIGGSCFQDKWYHNKNSYYFSNYIHIWGWATWKRAWLKYTYNITEHIAPGFTELLKTKFPDKHELNFWKKNFDEMAVHAIDTWDIQWSYSVYKNNGIGITPTVNLISNIGFGADATHTLVADNNITALPLGSIYEIRHPASIHIFKRADRNTFKKLFQFGNTKFSRLKFKLGQKVPLIKQVYNKLFKAP